MPTKSKQSHKHKNHFDLTFTPLGSVTKLKFDTRNRLFSSAFQEKNNFDNIEKTLIDVD